MFKPGKTASIQSIMGSTKDLFCVFLIFGFLRCTGGQDCSSFTDCRSCIQSPLQCQWCAKPNITGRCTPASVVHPNCEAEFVQNPTGSQTVLRTDSLSDDVQITPQAVSIKVRPGHPQSVSITVRPAAVFPLDVYFLMDFSGSMNDDLETLKSIAGDIAHNISTITTNFTLGFGSFVDKQTSPYIDVRPDQLLKPCRRDQICEESYSYRHFHSLTSDSVAFTNAVNGRIISGNLDSPEGGMEALLQAVVCQDVIGWRENPARRLLVYMSDASFHFGGDGKIGGVVTPHDGQCHLRRVTSGSETYYEYEQALRLDYPSVAMIKSHLLEKGISPIFLVTSTQRAKYTQLQTAIDNAVVEELDGNSQNLINALTEGYNKLVSNVRLLAESVPGLEVSFSADCGRTAIPDFAGGCTGVDIGSMVTITATVSVTECTERLINGTSFKISSALFGEVTVDVQGVCSCDCEMNRMVNSSDCSNQGELVCGLCECTEGRIGDQCECSIIENSGPASLMCRTGPNGLVCSGPDAGECVCGQCKCRQDVNPQIPGSMYFGEMCECNNFQCGVDTRARLCSGNGVCGCNGTCTCNEGFSGDICECRPNEECREPVGGEFCSGVGKCACGVCTCDEGYAGSYCDFCINAEICGPDQCSRYTNCTNCLYSIVDGVFQETGVESCQSICDAVNATVMADTISGLSDPRLNSTFTCTTAVGCSAITFYVKSNNGSVDILVSTSPAGARCPSSSPTISAWVIAIPIVVALLILALSVIVLARLIIFAMDRHEYRVFQKEVAKSHFGANDNPLYKSAIQEFPNPTFMALDKRGQYSKPHKQ